MLSARHSSELSKSLKESLSMFGGSSLNKWVWVEVQVPGLLLARNVTSDTPAGSVSL